MRRVFNSLQVRFLVLSLLAVMVTSGISLFLLQYAAQQLRSTFQSHGWLLTRQAAFTLAPLVAFDSKPEMAKALAALATDPSLSYVFVCGELREVPLAFRGAATARCDQRGSRAAPGVWWDTRQLHTRAPITDNGETWGYVQLGLSLDSIEGQINKMRTAAAASAAVAVLFSILVGLYLSRSVARPIMTLAAAASRVGLGYLDTEITVRSADEVGRLAEAFRTMLSQLSATMVSREELRESEERYALAAKGSNDGLWDWDLRTGQAYFSPRWKAVLGVPDHQLAGQPSVWLDRLHPDDKERVNAEITSHLAGQTRHFESEHRLLNNDGMYRWVLCRGLAVRDEASVPSRMAGSLTDISAAKVADPLTGLPNRLFFADLLERVIEHCTRAPGREFAVLFLDLDRFKVVNDSLGHLVGDQLLLAFAGRAQHLLSTVAPQSVEAVTLARLGGDEFTILLDGISSTDAAGQIATSLQQILRQPFDLGGHEIFVSASIGIAFGPGDYQAPEDLLRDADTAMYRAKALGKARHEVFDTALHESAISRLRQETDLRRAVEQQLLKLHYQPIYTLDSGQLIGFEALVRWPHPERGIIAPGDFIYLAEEMGLIVQLGEWVLREACTQMVSWQAQFASREPLFVSVNLSGRQLLCSDLAQRVSNVLRETGLAPACLKLEVTESVIMENPQAATELLKQLRALGVELAIDDFGTGYSSLSYLHNFPFTSLKIDRSFISRLEGAEGAEIVRAITVLARNLGMSIVAEGVENQQQWSALQELGCEFGQGYLFAKPLDPASAAALLLNTLRGEALANLAAELQSEANAPSDDPLAAPAPSARSLRPAGRPKRAMSIQQRETDADPLG